VNPTCRITTAIALLAAACCASAAPGPGTSADRTVETLQKLADAAGPSGFEEPVRAVLVGMMKPLASSLTYDGMGLIIATQASGGPRIMVDSHMDELGGMVRRIMPNGLLTMQMLGGWLDQALPDQRWVIIGSKGPVKAVTGIHDVHVVPPEERSKVYPRDSLFLDVGAANEAEVRAMGISPGDPIVSDAPVEILNGTQNYLGKGWDDRVGCAVIVEAMRRLANEPHPNQIVWVITTQEEIGLRGAHTAANVAKSDLGIALEGGITGDVFPRPSGRDAGQAWRWAGHLSIRVGAAEREADGVREADRA
jgi:endoglucanase